MLVAVIGYEAERKWRERGEGRGATTVTVMLGRGARRTADYPRGGTGRAVQPERGAFQVGNPLTDVL